MSNDSDYKTVVVRVSTDLHRRARLAAIKVNVTLSEVLRKALEEFCQENEEKRSEVHLDGSR